MNKAVLISALGLLFPWSVFIVGLTIRAYTNVEFIFCSILLAIITLIWGYFLVGQIKKQKEKKKKKRNKK